MNLGPVSYVDCIVFLLFLAPQLLVQAGLLPTLACILHVLPFLVITLPYTFIHERYLIKSRNRTAFTLRASPFEDFVVRCLRYAFANIPARIGRVFFSKQVVLPFLRFRMLRHGHLRSLIQWHEVSEGCLKGLWITFKKSEEVDIVIYYAHGGGFSMGSSYFYLEFFLCWLSLLKVSGFKNPAIFALEYSLVPDACYPLQLQQAKAGYEYVLSITKDSSKICVGGDSAGGAIMLSFLLQLARSSRSEVELEKFRPGMAILISPWATLVSLKDRNTPSDYLDITALRTYARQYTGPRMSMHDPLVSAGQCKDPKLWVRASPSRGFVILFGEEEVFAPQIRDLVTLLRSAGVDITVQEENGEIHCWPVASLYLSSTKEGRERGLKTIVNMIRALSLGNSKI